MKHHPDLKFCPVCNHYFYELETHKLYCKPVENRYKLTTKEMQIVEMKFAGKSDNEIAKEFSVGAWRIRKMKRVINFKLKKINQCLELENLTTTQNGNASTENETNRKEFEILDQDFID